MNENKGQIDKQEKDGLELQRKLEHRARVIAEIREAEAREKAIRLIEDNDAMARMLFQENQEQQRIDKERAEISTMSSKGSRSPQ